MHANKDDDHTDRGKLNQLFFVTAPVTYRQSRSHRKTADDFWQNYPLAEQKTNGDEEKYSDRRANFSKGLPHNHYGLVDPDAYDKLSQSMASGAVSDYGDIPMAMPSAPGKQFANPQKGMGTEFLGPDPEHLALIPPPSFASVESAAEITELYWMALLRDLHFAYYPFSQTVEEAIADLEYPLADNRRLRQMLPTRDSSLAAPLTAKTLFRGCFKGEEMGPYLSQFLVQDCFIGSQQVDQRRRTVRAKRDHLTHYDHWLAVQRGLQQTVESDDPMPRFIRNGRDLGQWVQNGQTLQAYLLTTLHLLASHAALNESNPYRNVAHQVGFNTFGESHILALVSEVAASARRAVWHQKWAVHRRLRPEAFAGRIHVRFLGASNRGTYGFDTHSAIEETNALSRIYGNYGSLLLPMALPNGAQLHPSYGSGNATVAGACTTILKAWFAGSQNFYTLRHSQTGQALKALHASADGRILHRYDGDEMYSLTVEGELNKLAGNIALAGCFAGTLWRSDAHQSLLLGEKVAIGTLMDYAGSFNEHGVRFCFQSFMGHLVEVGEHQVWIDGVAVVHQNSAFSDELAALDC